MIGQTIAEVFGHILFSFTRSVAEHYSFHEGENQSAIFGYDTLDDTGKEWYSQPVDEVIYQEYSNSEALTRDYLTSNRPDVRIIDASSTDYSEQSQEVSNERAMAWKQLRPSIVRTIRSSLRFALFISILTAFTVGLASIVSFYFSFQIQLICLFRKNRSLSNCNGL